MGFFNKYNRKDTEPDRKKLLIQGWYQILIYVDVLSWGNLLRYDSMMPGRSIKFMPISFTSIFSVLG